MKQGKKLNKKVLLLLLLPLIFIALPIGRYLITTNRQEEELPPAPVVAGYPNQGVIERSLQYTGTLTAENTTMVIPKVAGRIEQIYVKENQVVEKGDILFRLDDEVPRLRAEQAKAAWEAARAQYEKAKRGARQEELENNRALIDQAGKDLEAAEKNLERSRKLYEAGTLPKADYEAAENAYRSAETRLENAKRSLRLMEEGAGKEELRMAEANAEAARKQYELALLELDYSSITAPVTGRAAKIMAEEGNMAGPSTPVAAIVNDELIFVDVAVPEKHYAAFIRRDEDIEASVSAAAYPDRSAVPGTVSRVASIIDPQSRTFNVEVAVRNREGLFKPGMYVTVTLTLEKIPADLLLPDSSIVFRDGGEAVFVLTKGASDHVELRSVEIGERGNGVVQILAGIGSDERIVFEGNSFLENGQKVRVIEES